MRIAEDEVGGLVRRLAEASGASCRVTLLEGERSRPLYDGLGDGEADLESLRLPVEHGGELEVAWREGDGPGGRLAETVGETARRLLVQNRELELFSRELAERYEQITLLTTISDVLGSVIRPERATEVILGELVAALGGGRATLWLRPGGDGDATDASDVAGGETRGAGASTNGRGPGAADGQDGADGSFPESGAGGGGDGGEAAERGPEEDDLQPFVCRGRCDPAAEALVEEARVVRRVHRRQEAVLSGPSAPSDPSAEGAAEGPSLLAVPVSYAPSHAPHRRLGVLSVLASEGEVAFSAGELRLLQAVAHQIGAAVQTGRLVEQSLRRERVMAELKLAHDLQLKLLPRLEGFSDLADVAARSEPADAVGGDFYLLIRLPEGRLGVMLGDVSSHGFSAALIMALTMSTAAIYAREQEEPGEVLARIHGQLRDDLASTEMYTSIFYGVLDPGESRLRYANAGHPFAWRVGEDGGSRLGALDPPLGMTEPRAYGQAETEWRPGRDLALLCTDGLVTGLGEDLGAAEDRLLACAVEASPGGAGAVVEALFARSEVRERADDRTALAVRV